MIDGKESIESVKVFKLGNHNSHFNKDCRQFDEKITESNIFKLHFQKKYTTDTV